MTPSRHDGPVYGQGAMRRGRLRVRASNLFVAQLADLRDGPVEIGVTRLRATRSPQANRFYWGVLIAALADHTGYPPLVMHEICKAKCLPRAVVVHDARTGEIRGEWVIGGSTRRLAGLPFQEYCESVATWATEDLGIVIPDEFPVPAAVPPRRRAPSVEPVAVGPGMHHPPATDETRAF